MWGGITLREKIVLGLLVVLLTVGALWRAMQPGASPDLQRVNGAGEHRGEAEEIEPVMLTVHLVGAVFSPGVYRLPAGSRVYELLEMGGGYTEEADLLHVNLARPLYDGEQVVIPRSGDSTSKEQNSGRININRATAEELSSLPGIGSVRAQSIVEHREKHGYFMDVTEIMDVSGIGTSIYNSIEDLITIY